MGTYPSPWVGPLPILHTRFEGIRGWVVREAMDYYVLCGKGSCEDFSFEGVYVRGGGRRVVVIIRGLEDEK
jgi:hypothetical protein